MSDERSPLHWATMENDLKKVGELLANGDDFDAADESGWTPLITAASAGYSHIADALIQAGANTRMKTKEGRTAFFYAIARCKLPTIDLFIQNGIVDWVIDKTGSNAVHRAVSNAACTVEVLQMLMNADAPFETGDGEGNTPIHLACYENRRDLATWMIQNVDASLDSPKNYAGMVPKQLFPAVEFNA